MRSHAHSFSGLTSQRPFRCPPHGPWTSDFAPLKSCTGLGKKVDDYLVEWRRERESEHKSTIAFSGYQRDSYILEANTPRFGSGEGKGTIEESVRGDDLYIMVDVCNYSLTYSLFGMTNHMSPDDHFQDLKRIIAAAAGKARTDTACHTLLHGDPALDVIFLCIFF